MLEKDFRIKIVDAFWGEATPETAKVGDGATIVLWSDRHACTIVKVTKAFVWVQRDQAVLSGDWKPEDLRWIRRALCESARAGVDIHAGSIRRDHKVRMERKVPEVRAAGQCPAYRRTARVLRL